MGKIILEENWANFLGFETIDKEGKRHNDLLVIRGNGKLRLEDDGIHFTRMVPEKSFFIPASKIKKVEISSSHNGKWVLFPIVLKIYYEEESEIKVFGIMVRWKRRKLWKERIENLMQK